MTSYRTLQEALGLGEGALVSFVGAGGKTSLMSRLAYELYEDHHKVAVTSTTHMAVDEVRDFWNAARLQELSERAIDEVLGRAVMVSRVPFFYSDTLSGEKLKGVSAEAAEKIHGNVDFLIVEADGGRKASFKIPREHEPVLPPSTTHLCIVMGSEIFEQPASKDLIFNLEELEKIMTIRQGEICPPSLIRKLLYRRGGYLKHAAAGRRVFLLINKVDSAEKVGSVMSLAGQLFHPGVDKIILSSAELGQPVVGLDNSRDRVAAVILAAGASERFGGQKLCREVEEEPIVRRVVRTSLESHQFERVCVVLGYKAGEVKGCLDILPEHDDLMLIENRNYADGIGRSIAEGVAAISQWADAVMILLADMPWVEPGLIETLLDTYKQSYARLCYPVLDDRHCHPVIFRKEFFPELTRLSGDEGARKICESNTEWAATVRLHDGKSQKDIDTPEDLKGA